jgi:2,3-bisphosphoglycerate-independent phosphoglycerate mutase
MADTPGWDAMLACYPNSKLRASGEDVGLKDGKTGNSEAGHNNLGAGRIVAQDDVRMDSAIKDGSFKTNPVFLHAVEGARKDGSALHLLAYLTEKSSHGCIDYPLMITEMAEGVDNVYLHIIFDGRSTEPGSAPVMLRDLDKKLESIGRGVVVDGIGRGIALDRDGNYAKIEKAYREMVYGDGTRYR